MLTTANPAIAQLLDSLTPEQLNTLPAANPPPGVVPNMTHPQWRVPEFFGTITPFLFIALIMYGIRVYMKIAVLRKWRIEDTTLTLGLLTTIAYYAIMSWGAVVGPVAKHAYEMVVGNPISRSGYMVLLCGTFLPIPALGLIKATIFLQYYQLFNPIRWMRICVMSGLVVTVLFYTAITITYISLMAQRPGETVAGTILSQHWVEAYNFFVPPGIVGTILDWYLLILPIPMVFNLNMTLAKKLAVLSIFMTGGLAAVASIVSLYYRSQMFAILADAGWDVVPITIWVHIELFCGIIAASMPTVHLFWQQHSNLMKISSKVKSSVKTILSLTSQSRISKASQERKRINNTKEKSNNKKNNNDSSTIINVRGNHNNVRSCPISSESSSSIKGEYRSKLMHYMGMKLLSDDEILVSRGFGISQVQVSVCRDGDENEDGAAQSDRSSQSTRVEHGLGQGYRQNFEDLEAQRSSSPGRRVAAERRQF